jgi:hypothetical protein
MKMQLSAVFVLMGSAAQRSKAIFYPCFFVLSDNYYLINDKLENLKF